MNTHKRYNPWRWAAITLVVVIVGGAAYVLLGGSSLLNGGSVAATTDTLPTVAIQSPDVATSATSASGNLALVDEREVPLAASGIVEEIAVEVGDTVQAGQVLLRLDTTDLERALAQANLSVESAQIALAELQEPATDAEIAQAEASLAEAQQSLADLQAGPGAAEVAAAQSSLAAAQSSYAELLAPPSDAELTQLSASLRKAEITLADAQGAYDKVAWRADAAASSAASELQAATIDYESTKAAYEEATAAAADSSVQSAVSSIQNAQASLDSLLTSATQAEIAAAEVQVVQAQATLDELASGPTANELRNAEITLEKALIELETAQRDLDGAVLVAPIGGVVTAIDAAVGIRSSADSVVFTLADPTQLELVIDVAESDIPNVSIGQEATVEVDAFPGKSYAGVVAAISPVNDSGSTSVSYPVTVRLAGDDLTGVLPGMNAVATLKRTQEVAENSWLVPSNAIRSGDGESTVIVVRSGLSFPVVVTPGAIQGEWTLVQSPDLEAGDEVVGTLTSSDDSSNFMGGPPGGGASIPMGGVMGGPPN